MTQLTVYIKDKSIAKLLIGLIKELPSIYMYEYDEYDKNDAKIEDKSYSEPLKKLKIDSNKND